MLSFTLHAKVSLSSVYVGIYIDSVAICWCVYFRTNEGIGMYTPVKTERKHLVISLSVSFSSCKFHAVLADWLRLGTMNFGGGRERETRKMISDHHHLATDDVLFFFSRLCMYFSSLVLVWLYCQSKNLYPSFLRCVCLVLVRQSYIFVICSIR
jgi:hypothetical protein